MSNSDIQTHDKRSKNLLRLLDTYISETHKTSTPTKNTSLRLMTVFLITQAGSLTLVSIPLPEYQI